MKPVLLREHIGLPVAHPTSREAWRRWLAAHHRSSSGVWLARWTTAGGRPVLPDEVIVEEALCFGWIDGRRMTASGGKPLVEVVPRRRGTAWSARNRGRVLRLIETGMMMPAGMAAVESARADGSWIAADAEALRR